MSLLKKSKGENRIIAKQNTIKKYDTCIAVYDIPEKYKNMSTLVCVHDYGKPTQGYKLYIYVPKK